jgi:hypothetical protein
MPLYRALSTIKLGDGDGVSFGHDDWLGDGALCHRAPALFSHATKQEVSVASVLKSGSRAVLVPRLTTAGERELSATEPLLGSVQLGEGADTWELSRCCKPSGELRVSGLYKLCSLIAKCVDDAILWRGRMPAGLRADTDAWVSHLRQAL